MIKTTFATDVFIIANTKAMKLKDITKPPSNPARPAFFTVLKASFLYIKSKKTETPRKKKNDLNNNIFQASLVSNDLTMKPPQLRQKPPKRRSIYPGTLYRNFI
tara:strand:+ start:397 stop:708 length:312 start_codon:yes stop_codon:yes gene_type:complete